MKRTDCWKDRTRVAWFRFGQSTLASALVLCLLGGCGSGGTAKTTGTAKVTVTHGGQSVSEGAVQLVVPGTSQSAYGTLDAAGTITFTEVETGNYTVVITPPPPPDPIPGSPAPVKEYPNIPPAYRDQGTSPLKADVKAGTNEFTFDLK